jgi:pSer/pThr/pTyr-binding forkhead associated (FHA) protein
MPMPEPTCTAMLRVIRGDDEGKGWDLVSRQTYTIGRSSKCNLRITDRTASATHAQIECRQGIWMINDMESSHGTRLNKQRLLGPKPLFDRDSIQCGQTLFEFREYEQLDPADLAEINRGIALHE